MIHLLVSVSNQAYIFLCSVIGGMLIAFIYDMFRIKRKTFKTRSIGVFIEDLVFWIIVALVMFAVVYYSNEGELRGFIFIGTVIGVILYMLLLSRFVMNFFLAILCIIKKILKKIWFIISYPFRIIIKILGIPCSFMVNVSKKTAKRVKRIGRSQLSKMAIIKRMFRNVIKKI